MIAVSSKGMAMQLRQLGLEICVSDMGITSAEFDTLVGKRERCELLFVLSPMRQDIVERR